MIMNSKILLAFIAAFSVPASATYDDCGIDFVVYNADDDVVVGLLDDALANGGGYYCIPPYEVNFQARPTPDCPTTLSALMDLDGPVESNDRTENFGPYMVFGDSNTDPNDFFGRSLLPGSYVLSSDIYSKRGLDGDLVVSDSVHFEAVYCDEFYATLDGDQEVPPIHTPVTGTASFEYDHHAGALEFYVVIEANGVEGLIGTAGLHLHCAPAGENGALIGFLAGAIEGGLTGTIVYKGTLTDANIIGDTECGKTIDELIHSFIDGGVYVNAHSNGNPGGEVRGQIAVSHS